jgi:hypothetical protein
VAQGGIRGEQLVARLYSAFQGAYDLASYESMSHRSVGEWNDLPINELKFDFTCVQYRQKVFD